MENAETKKIDKSNWGPGPWQEEPDRIEFEHAGMPCLMRRVAHSGNWCGYAAVPPGHPWHGKKADGEYDYEEGKQVVPRLEIEVHGGVTFEGSCSGEICHVPKPGEPDDVWWFGFDTAHAWDLSPRCVTSDRIARGWMMGDETYRDAAYVRRETERLAEQLAAASK